MTGYHFQNIRIKNLPPACPIRRPGGAVNPAINATTGFSVPLS